MSYPLPPSTLFARAAFGLRLPRDASASLRGMCTAILSLAAAHGTLAADAPSDGGAAADEPRGMPAAERTTRLSYFVGAFAGFDSNPTREPSAGEMSNWFTEYLAGFALDSSSPRVAFDVRYQMLAERFGEQADWSFDESRALLDLRVNTSRVRYGLRVEHRSLVEPAAIEIDDNLPHTELMWGPEADIAVGSIEIGVGVNGSSSRYDDAGAAVYLDADTLAIWTEARWRDTTLGRQELFAHLAMAGTAYVDHTVRSDFDRLRLYAGWRSEERGTSGIEIAVGNDSVTSHDGSELYGSIRYRTSLAENADSVEFAYVRGAEAAATAEYKVASTMLVRYLRSTGSRLTWSVVATSERALFEDYDAAPDPSLTASRELSLSSLEATLQKDFGSFERAHGRWHLGMRLGSRTGTADGSGYSRFRFLAGVSLVY